MVSGVLVLAALFVVGVAVTVPAMEDDLSSRADAALAAAGIAASVSFDGQSASVACPAPLTDPDGAVAVVSAVEGVRSVSLAATCGATDGSVASTTTMHIVDSISSDGGTAPPTTVVATTVAPTTVAPTTSAPDAPEPGVVSITFQEGRLAMLGLVATEQQHADLLTAAAQTVAPQNITDGVRDDATVPVDDASVAALVAMLRAMTVPLVSAELGWRPDGVYARGVYVDDASRAAFEQAAGAVGVTPLMVERQAAGEAEAAAVRDKMNAIVAETPIEFGKGQITVSPSSMYVLERLAGVAKSYRGVIVQVQGHTDSEGDAGRNLTLSEQRAAAVRDELVLLGVPAAEITSVGFGETQLVTDANGVELPDQSRRVVFDVTVE